MKVLKSVLKKEEYIIKDNMDDGKKNNETHNTDKYLIINKKYLDSLKKNPEDFLSNITNISNSQGEINLVNLLQKLNYSYYIEGNSLLSDDLYDYIKNYLKKINPANSILNNIGVSNIYKTKLPFHMGSMDKINTDEKSLKNWLKKYNKNGYVLSDKLDGISALFVKNDNGECKLYTRGDGTTGKDISYLINFIKGLTGLSNSITIRGELIISKKNFNKIRVEGRVMNCRNIVAGVVNSKKPNLEIAKLIKFVSYELIFPKNLPAKEQFDYLKSNKYTNVFNLYKDDISINTLSEILEDRRKNSKYDIDGIIVTDNNNHERIMEGNPKYSFAFKNINTLNKKEVMIIKVEWNITKDKYIQPVVIFEGIEIDGVIVRKATGKNAKFIKDNNIGPGSKILIVRRGDVIPHIEDIMSSSENGKAQMPDYPYEWNETSVDIILPLNQVITNVNILKETNIKNMENFIAKMGFKGISIGIVKKFHENNIDTISKFINITKEQLLNFEGIKEKKANNIIISIHETLSNIDNIKLMTASNCFGRGFGILKLKLIMNNLKDKEFKIKPTIGELTSIKGIEKKTALKFIKNIDNYLKFLEDTQIKINYENEVNENEKNENENGANENENEANENKKLLNNLNFVFSGIRDKELEKLIETNGGNIKTVINKDVNFLIIKDKDAKSSKIDKALKLKLNIITLIDFKMKYNLNHK